MTETKVQILPDQRDDGTKYWAERLARIGEAKPKTHGETVTETKVETKPPVEAPKMPQKPPSVHDIERAKSIQILPQLLGIMQNFGVAEIEGLGWRIKLHPAMIDDAMAAAKAARTAKLLEEASKKPLGDDDLTPAQPTPVPQPMDPNHDYLDDPEKNPE